MNKKIKILISNDDGVHAPGISALANALKPLGEIVVVAPDGPRSGASAQITSQVPLRLTKMKEEVGCTWYRSTGTPADCVKLALNIIYKEEKPDLVVTGINHGRNDGICVIYSGTIGAAMEGCIAGIPSLAVSVNDHGDNAEMSYATAYTPKVARWMLQNPIPKETLLSLNLPKHQPKGLEVCPQAVGRFVNEFVESENAKGQKVYWLSGNQIKTKEEPNTDWDLLETGYATLTPIRIDMTDRSFLEELRNNTFNDLLAMEKE